MSPRGCLLSIGVFVVIVLGVLWFALPPVIGGLAVGALENAGVHGTGTHVDVAADPPLRLLLLEADRVLREEGMNTVPVLQVLDEVLFDVAEEELEEAARLCSSAMKNAYELEVPLKVGVEAGKNWADLEPVKI